MLIRLLYIIKIREFSFFSLYSYSVFQDHFSIFRIINLNNKSFKIDSMFLFPKPDPEIKK